MPINPVQRNYGAPGADASGSSPSTQTWSKPTSDSFQGHGGSGSASAGHQGPPDMGLNHEANSQQNGAEFFKHAALWGDHGGMPHGGGHPWGPSGQQPTSGTSTVPAGTSTVPAGASTGGASGSSTGSASSSLQTNTVNSVTAPAGSSSSIAQMLTALNASRASEGKPPVTLDPALSQLAQSHSNDMQSQNSMFHNSLSDILATGATGAAQNITGPGYTADSANSTFYNEKNNPADDQQHYQNMMGDYSKVGIGVSADGRWTVDFAN